MRKKTSKIILLVLLFTIMYSVKVSAVEFVNLFTNQNITRENMMNMLSKSSSLNSTTLSISAERSTGNSYKWNFGTTGDGKTVWKISNDNAILSLRDNIEVYFCLNATRGFGETQGQMAEGSKDEYTDILDMKLENNVENIKNYAGGTLKNNYNKVVWILDNIYTPINSSEYRTNAQYINLMKNAGIEISGQNWDITEEEIEVIEQMAIWYYTNSDNSDYNKNNLPSMYLNNNQISGIYYGTDEYGVQIDGKIKQENLNKLYKYYIHNADENYNLKNANISLDNTFATVSERDNYLYIGPFTIEKENEIVNNIEVYLNNNVLSKNEYVLNSKADIHENISDYNTLSSFYVIIEKAKVNDNSIIKLEIESEYTNRTLKFMTNEEDYENTQPVVMIKDNIKTDKAEKEITVIYEEIPKAKIFDLALRKYITKVNNIEYSREPKVDVSTIATVGTATYKHSKTPIVVQKGDIVTYTIRVYNEGEINGYVDSITDYLPQYLLPIIDGVDGIDSEKYKEEIDFNSNYCWIYLKENNSITTDVTSKLNSEVYSILTKNSLVTDTLLNAFEEGNNELDYIDVEVKCLVSEDVVSGMYLTNIAEITESQDINGNSGDGADSIISNVDFSNLTDYKNNEAINSNNDSYIEGQEDDDDFEKLLVKEFDLSLRKFVTKVNNVLYNRMPIVDTSSLGRIGNNNKLVTTAKYNHTKNPVIVETGDIVTYTIRVYNEGSLDGYANEVIDNVPEGLEFIINNDINLKYKWRMLNANGEETSNVSEAVKIVTDYLSCEENLLKSVKEENGIKVLDYKDIEVQFKVIAVADKNKDNIIKNVAQISADSSNDIDSIPSRNEEYDYIHNTNEDDIDYEPIKLQYFDLALRKFITKVNNLDYNNRIPEIIYNEGSISYKHTKEPVLTRENDIVEYTIRIYNEGEKNGTATEIIDNLPQGLEFILDNETNTKYGWKLIDKDGNEVETLENAVAVKTDYLKNTNIDGIQKNDNGETILKYADVKIAFKVIEKGTSDIIITNIAEISKDSDNDIDSIPNNNIDDEDDIDKEHLKVNYFDLSLKKYVTQSEITLEDKTDIVPTGFNENSEGIAKVDIIASKIKKTNVKFVYNIKITNEGKIAGYATEIKDYIPQGLIFIQEDNPDWKMLEDGNIVTEQLSNTLLNPGESAVVTIKLTWENSVSNLGLKTNYAEISKDSDNDIDSTPDNYTIGEDDIDEAQVILSIKTGPTENYIILTLICITILASGIVLIKKYVL